jgi:hypothetical protein
MSLRTLSLAACLVLAATARAPAQAPAHDPATELAARNLVATIGGDAQITRIFAAMRGGIIQIIVKNGHVSTDKATSAYDDILAPAMKTHVGELTAALTEIYADNYTAAELKALQGFYETPLGRKVLEKQPVISAESVAVGRAWGARVGRQAFEEHREDLQKRGITL